MRIDIPSNRLQLYFTRRDHDGVQYATVHGLPEVVAKGDIVKVTDYPRELILHVDSIDDGIATASTMTGNE